VGRLPRIAIVGRPNVGKSSLFNRLLKRRLSIVDDQPGVTRDRVATVVELTPPLDAGRGARPVAVELVDTGGFGVYVVEGKRYDEVGEDLSRLTPDIEAQIKAARTGADLVLFVVDARSGLTSLDETVARMLREEGVADRVVVLANKVDGPAWVAHGLEAAGLGLGEPRCVSATTGHGMREVVDLAWERLSSIDLADADADADDRSSMRISIIGKRNAGKSTLVNAIAGEPRMIVSEIAGTTRDAVDVRFERDGEVFTVIDTAGVRKRKSIADDVEFYAFTRMQDALHRSDVTILLLDATKRVSQVDKKLSQEIQDCFKPVVIAINKIDLLDRDRISPEDYLEYLTEQLRGLDFAPIVFLSAKDGEGVDELVDMCRNLYAQATHREPTASVNAAVAEIMGTRGPSSRLGTQAKLYYAAQVDVSPPTIALKVNRPELFEGGYERYLLNRLRERLPYSEVPIRLVFSPRNRKSLEEVKKRGRDRAKLENALLMEGEAFADAEPMTPVMKDASAPRPAAAIPDAAAEPAAPAEAAPDETGTD